MEINNPAFIKIKKHLIPIILKLLEKYNELTTMEIGKLIKEMKEKDEKSFELISFDYLSDYSYQIRNVILRMLWGLIEQTNTGYKLSVYGKKEAEKISDELLKKMRS